MLPRIGASPALGSGLQTLQEAVFADPAMPLRLVLPQVIQVAGFSDRVVARPAEEPEIARRIDPACGAFPFSRDVAEGEASERAIDSRDDLNGGY